MEKLEMVSKQHSICQCCNKPQRYEGFHQLIELKDNGFNLYWYFGGTNDVNEARKVSNTTSEDGFILHNTKNKQISSQGLLSQLDNSKMPCPRCRQIYKHARQLLNKMPVIGRRDLIGVCNHCQLKASTQKACNKCDTVIKKFLSTYNAQKDDPKKYIKMWLSKLERLILNKTQQKVMSTKKLCHCKSEVDFDQLLCKGISKTVRNFKTKVMFHSKTSLDLSKAEKHSLTQLLQKQASGICKDTLGTIQLLQKFGSSFSSTSSESLREYKKRGQPDHVDEDDIRLVYEENKFRKIKKSENEKNEFFKKVRDNFTATEKNILMKQSLCKDLDELQKVNPVEEKNYISTGNQHLLKKKGVKGKGTADDIAKKRTKKVKHKSKHAVKQQLAGAVTVTELKEKTTVVKDLGNNVLTGNKQPKSKILSQLIAGNGSKVINTRPQNKENLKDIKGEEAKDTREVQKEHSAYLEVSKKLKMDNLIHKEELRKKKQTETELETVNISGDKYLKDNKKILIEAKANVKIEVERPDAKLTKIPEASEKELNISQVKLIKPSTDNLLLELMELKKKDNESNARELIFLPPVDPIIIKSHKSHLKRKMSNCAICYDSELKGRVENYEYALQSKPDKMIIGERITKYKPILSKELEAKKHDTLPQLFHSQYLDEFPLGPKAIETIKENPKNKNKVDPESNKGVIRYALSDRTFIDKGWTILPTEKIVRKMNVYRMRPAHPEFDWFEHNKNKRLMHYDTGEKLAEFKDNGRCRWYYRNGRIALDYYDAEEIKAQQRFVVYSSGEPDERGRSHPVTILATFDYLGNGIVFDHAGKIRLKYNQTEGVVLDRNIGPVSHWKWHTLNDPPVLQQVMIDTQMPHKDSVILQMYEPQETKTRLNNEEMLAIEFDNFVKEKSKKLSQKFKPIQIKMKAFKINEHLSLRVLDQATIYLIFRDGSTNIKLNIGMVLDHQEIVDTDTAELGEVSNNLERFPAHTDSVVALQRSVANAQRFERTRTERERRLRPPVPCASADQLTAALSRPLRPPLLTVPTASTSSTICGRLCRKPINNLYYSTRLL